MLQQHLSLSLSLATQRFSLIIRPNLWRLALNDIVMIISKSIILSKEVMELINSFNSERISTDVLTRKLLKG